VVAGWGLELEARSVAPNVEKSISDQIFGLSCFVLLDLTVWEHGAPNFEVVRRIVERESSVGTPTLHPLKLVQSPEDLYVIFGRRADTLAFNLDIHLSPQSAFSISNPFTDFTYSPSIILSLLFFSRVSGIQERNGNGKWWN